MKKKVKNRSFEYIYISVLILVYIVYYKYISHLSGFHDFFVIDSHLFAKLVLFIFPVYIIFAITKKEKLLPFDLFAFFVPIILLFILVIITGSKSGATFFLAEIPAVLFISCIYLLKYLLPDKSRIRSYKRLNMSILSFECLVVILMHFLIIPLET